MKKYVLLVAVLSLLLSGCGQSAPAPAPSEPEAEEIVEVPPAMEIPPDRVPVVTETVSIPATEAPSEADPDEFVKYDWKPSQEVGDEFYNSILPLIESQPFYIRSEFNNGNNVLVYVNCDPATLSYEITPFLRAARDKFYELREDKHFVIFIGFTAADVNPSFYDVWYSDSEIE